MGAAAALIIGCKSTYLPHVFFLLAAYYLLRCRDVGIARVLAELSTSGVTCILLLPWAIAMRMTSGTAFYPIFGHGYDYSAYYHLPPTWTFHTRGALLKVFGFVLPLVPFLIAEIVMMRFQMAERETTSGAASPAEGRVQRTATLALVVAAIAGSIFAGLVTGGDSLRRYNYPCVLPALLFLLLSALSQARTPTSAMAALVPARHRRAAALLVRLHAALGEHLSRDEEGPLGVRAPVDYRPSGRAPALCCARAEHPGWRYLPGNAGLPISAALPGAAVPVRGLPRGRQPASRLADPR